jgi:hypothetical protein
MRGESSTPNADQANLRTSDVVQLLAGDARSRSAAKGAATLLRHKAEQRADRLSQMRAQIADGTLVVRQMTTAQRMAAPQRLTDCRRVRYARSR